MAGRVRFLPEGLNRILEFAIVNRQTMHDSPRLGGAFEMHDAACLQRADESD